MGIAVANIFDLPEVILMQKLMGGTFVYEFNTE
jgi:hypothetical protein